jgi:hypothetical protein
MQVDKFAFRLERIQESAKAIIGRIGELSEHYRIPPPQSQVGPAKKLRHEWQPYNLVVRFVKPKVVRASDVKGSAGLQDPHRFPQTRFLIAHVLDDLVHGDQVETSVTKW